MQNEWAAISGLLVCRGGRHRAAPGWVWTGLDGGWQTGPEPPTLSFW
jgi:hypothetical protein